MGLLPSVALPPVTAEYKSALQHPGASAPAAPSQYKFTRATDGQTRVDSGNMSVISNPATSQTTVLDHLKKTATIQPMPTPTAPKPTAPQMPGFSPPALPGQPHAPAVKVEDLGKSILQGHEVEGKKFTMQPPATPKPPAFKMPSAPKLPGFQMPSAPKPPGFQMPSAPKPPGLSLTPPKPPIPSTPTAPKPSTAEVWTSTSMKVPMLTKMSGGFGQLTQTCHSAVPGEPHPSTFQIPPGYKTVVPAPPVTTPKPPKLF